MPGTNYSPDIDELRYNSSGPAMGTFLFTPHGADHGWGRGYTKKEKTAVGRLRFGRRGVGVHDQALEGHVGEFQVC